MATARLVASDYYRSNSSYISVSSQSNAYKDTDSENYATIKQTRNGVAYDYYYYLRGFNFNAVPSGAVVSGFKFKVKASQSNLRSAEIEMTSDTGMVSGGKFSDTVNSTVRILEGPNPAALTWDVMKGYGSNFGFRFRLRRNTTSSDSILYLYGAEIEVTYEAPETKQLFVKQDGLWTPVQQAYAKSGGAWSQVDPEQAFQQGVNYIAG